MEEHEVELIDYLRVLWWGKWIVLACFVLAVGIAAAVIWAKPAGYSVTGSYEVRETLSLYVSSQSAAMLTNYAVQALPNLNTPRLQRSVSQKDPNLLDVTISGTASPKAVEAALTSSTAALEAGLVTQVEQALARERGRVETEFGQLIGQVDILRERMAGETNAAVLKAFPEKVATLEVRLAEVSVRRAELGVLVSKELVSLREIDRSSVVDVARNAKTTLAVAGFLGLFLGTLLAFLVHYLISAARRDKAACGKA